MELKEIQRRLLERLADGAFHSGRELSEQLGLSRTAVWNHFKNLEKLGLDLCAVTGKGYRLSQPLELLDASKIHSNMGVFARSCLDSLKIHDIIDSTSRQLSAAANLDAVSGAVYLAECQTDGRGRLGRKWVSPYGRNICLSLLWHYEVGPAALSGLSLAVGMAVTRALQAEGIDEAGLKWPNDIFYDDRKLGGVLVEVMGDSLGPCKVVVGLGLNIDLPNEAAGEIDQPWIDLKEIVGQRDFSRNRLTGLLLNELLSVLNDFDQTGLRGYLDEWSKWDCMAGKPALLRVGGEVLHGTVRGINETGMLLFEDAKGESRAYASGEVSLRPIGKH